MHGLIFETSVCYWQNQPGCYLLFWTGDRLLVQQTIPEIENTVMLSAPEAPTNIRLVCQLAVQIGNIASNFHGCRCTHSRNHAASDRTVHPAGFYSPLISTPFAFMLSQNIFPTSHTEAERARSSVRRIWHHKPLHLLSFVDVCSTHDIIRKLTFAGSWVDWITRLR